jgi:hypothetical protein
MGRDAEVTQLTDAAGARGVPLSPSAYLAALGSLRTPAALRSLINSMASTPKLRWLRKYNDAPVSSVLALAGALGIGGEGRDTPALYAASEAEIHAGLQALVMSDSASAGGVSAMLQDLRASGVAVSSRSRIMLLSTAMLEGWVQQQLAINVWLPLLSPLGEELGDVLGSSGSLRFVETPSASGFKGAFCFDWRGPDVHPVLREWMRARARTDPRFDSSSPFSGLCPVDIGVYVLEGMLLALQANGGPPSAVSMDVQLSQLQQALQALVVRYEAATSTSSGGVKADGTSRGGRGGDGGRPGRGFKQRYGAAVTAPALSAQRGVLREILLAMDLQQGIRFGSQCQTAKVFILTLNQILAQLTRRPPATATSAAVTGMARPSKGAERRPAARGGGKGKPGSKPKGKGGGVGSAVMTKRERRAFDELARDGLIGLGAVDPSPQRTTVATAAAISLLLAEDSR